MFAEFEEEMSHYKFGDHPFVIKPKKLKSTGFFGYRKVSGDVYHTGNSYFVTVIAKYDHFTGKNCIGRIAKHFPLKRFTLWDAKRFCKFMVNNFPDYIETKWD